MKQYLVGLFLILSMLSLKAQTTVLKAAAYVDVSAGSLVTPATIIIEKGIITAINPKKLPKDATVIDLGTQILLPGLMDMHVHLNMDFIPNYTSLLVTDNAAMSALRASKNAETTLMAGFTTVRNLGQVHPSIELIDVALADASDQGWIHAPRIIATGHMVGITGGHSDLAMMGGFAETVMDLGPAYGIADGPQEFLKATPIIYMYILI